MHDGSLQVHISVCHSVYRSSLPYQFNIYCSLSSCKATVIDQCFAFDFLFCFRFFFLFFKKSHEISTLVYTSCFCSVQFCTMYMKIVIYCILGGGLVGRKYVIFFISFSNVCDVKIPKYEFSFGVCF